jgi:hypothetical protein
MGFGSDQGAIWEELSTKAARMGVESSTGAMKDIFDEYHVPDSKLKESLGHQEKQVGFLAFIRGGFAGGDIFASERLSRRKFYKLARSYHLDALDKALSFPRVSTEAVIQQLTESRSELVKSPGIGKELRFLGKEIQGSAILLDEQVAHVTLFPKIESERPRRRWWPL